MSRDKSLSGSPPGCNCSSKLREGLVDDPVNLLAEIACLVRDDQSPREEAIVPGLLGLPVVPIRVAVQAADVLPVPGLAPSHDREIRQVKGAIRGTERHLVTERDSLSRKQVRDDQLGLRANENAVQGPVDFPLLVPLTGNQEIIRVLTEREIE